MTQGIQPKYVPVLAAKRGEFNALEQLSGTSADLVYPLVVLEAPPVGRRTAKNPNPAPRPTDRHMEHLVKGIRVRVGRRTMVDLREVEGLQVNGQRADEFALDAMRGDGAEVVPVLRTDSSPDATAVALAHAAASGAGIAMRLERREVPALAATVTAWLGGTGVAPGDIDLVVDLASVGNQFDAARLLTADVVSKLRAPNRFRTTTIALGSFIERVSDIGTNANALHPRTDLAAWTAEAPGRGLLYGDYCISHPDAVSVPYRGAPSIKYAVDDHWWILRGQSGTPQQPEYRQMATAISASPHFAGTGTSWGDTYIANCAAGSTDNHGGPTTWVGVGVNRHIEKTVTQV